MFACVPEQCMQKGGPQHCEVGRDAGCRGIPARCFPAYRDQQTGNKGSGWQPPKHVSGLDDRHVTTGHEQPPRLLHAFVVNRAIFVKDVASAREHPMTVGEASGKLRRFRNFHPERDHEAWPLTATTTPTTTIPRSRQQTARCYSIEDRGDCKTVGLYLLKHRIYNSKLLPSTTFTIVMFARTAQALVPARRASPFSTRRLHSLPRSSIAPPPRRHMSSQNGTPAQGNSSTFNLWAQIREARPAVRYTVYAGLGLMATVESTFWYNVAKAKWFPSAAEEEKEKAEQLLRNLQTAVKGFRVAWMKNYQRYYGSYIWGLGYGGLDETPNNRAC